MQLTEFIEKQWSLPYKDQALFFRLLASPLSLLYRFLIYIHTLKVKKGSPFQLPGKCISIGNITIGGTGKTPITRFLAIYLKEKGKNPAIITRGYKSSLKKNQWVVLLDGNIILGNTKYFHGDEPTLLSKSLANTPILVGSNRVNTCTEFLKTSPNIDTWILDDGFQHHNIQRQCNIVLLDSQNPFGNEELLPLGPLREPQTQLKRSDLIIFTKYHNEKRTSLFNQATINLPFRQLWKNNRHPPLGVKLLATVGIANGYKLIDQWKKDNYLIDQVIQVGDHQLINRKEFHNKIKFVDGILTTSKDFYRQPDLYEPYKHMLYIADIEPIFDEKSYQILDLVLKRENIL